LVALKGWTAPDVGRAYARARELCQHVGDPTQLFPILCGLRDFSLVRAELQTARELEEELLRVAQEGQTPAWLAAAHQRQGHTLFHLGDFMAAHSHYERAMGVLTSERLGNPIRRQPDGLDPLMHCLAWWARVLWFLGYPTQGRQRMDEALTLARQLAHPFNLVTALSFGTVFHWWCSRERLTFEQLVEESLALATEHGFTHSIATRTVRQGVLLITGGHHESGQALVSQGLEAYRATGAAIRQPGFYAEVAAACNETGQSEAGLAAVTEGLTHVNRTGERWCEAELYRLKGELLLQQAAANSQQAVACFQQALAIARRQQAKSLELRVTMSLCRVWQQQGQSDEAYQLLADIYGWFTEGFDTVDLQEARVLLETLA
jgi:predicted ATPase